MYNILWDAGLKPLKIKDCKRRKCFESSSVLEGRYGVILTVKSPSKEEIRLGFSIYLSFGLIWVVIGSLIAESL